MTNTTSPCKVAFALGGLAGNNGHGAGFLQAALDHDVQPIMISCTSGQIRWVLHYLEALQQADSRNLLRERFMQELALIRRTGNINLDVALQAMVGRENICRPSYEYVFADVLSNVMDLWSAGLQACGNVLLADQMLSLIPARTLVLTSGLSYFERVSRAFNAAPIGIAFNAYNPQEGVEYVYLNQRAMALLHDPANPQKQKNNRHSDHHYCRYYQEITTEAVRNALWLYQYGFYDKRARFVDGAYFRDMMLGELVAADLIFAVRPVNRQWQGELPRTYQGVEDLKTRVGFNSSYAAERDQIMLVNKLLAAGCLSDGGPEHDYHPIEVVDLEIAGQRGYFGYVLECQSVFDAAEAMAAGSFAQLAGRGLLPALPSEPMPCALAV